MILVAIIFWICIILAVIGLLITIWECLKDWWNGKKPTYIKPF